MMFELLEGLMTVMILLTIGIFAVVLLRVLWHLLRNRTARKRSIAATVVGRRAFSNRRCNSNGCRHEITRCYVTFRLDSGEEMEFHVPDWEYAQYPEGSAGTLTLQGTRFLGFERI